MDGSRGDVGKWPFPEQADDAEDEIDDLENGSGFHRTVEVCGEKVPEDLGPEEAFYGRSDLIYIDEWIRIAGRNAWENIAITYRLRR